MKWVIAAIVCLALLLTLSAVVAVMIYALSFYRDLRMLFTVIWKPTGLDEEWILPVFKIIAISLITRLGSDICKDSKQSALAAVVDISGTVCALLSAKPLFGEVLTMMTQLG